MRVTKAITGAPDELINQAFRDIRHEGKNLPSPSPEMVAAFARSQQDSTMINNGLTPHERLISSRAWGQAIDDTPDGGTFHAWKHTMGEVMRRMSARLTAIGASAALSFGLAACGSGGGTLTPEPTGSATPSISASPSGSIVHTDNPKFGISANGQKVTDSFGTYTQIALSPSSILLKLDSTVIEKVATDKFSNADIDAAQKVVANFLISEGADSILAFDKSQDARNKWLIANKSKFSADTQSELTKAINTNTVDQGFGVLEGNTGGGWRDTADIKPVPYTADAPRVYFEDVKLTDIGLIKGDLSMTYSLSYVRLVTVAGDTKKTHIEKVNSTQSYSVRKAADGTWKLTGWQNKFDINCDTTIN